MWISDRTGSRWNLSYTPLRITFRVLLKSPYDTHSQLPNFELRILGSGSKLLFIAHCPTLQSPEQKHHGFAFN